MDIFHEDFRRIDGSTRIRALLDLSDPGDVDGDGILDGSGPFGGTLHTESDINASLQAGSSPSRDTTGHGTHGLSVAAGDDPTLPGVAPEADLLVVKATREDGSLSFTSSDLVNALAFVDQTAADLSLPYVVNLSLGTLFSSHDGRSLEEQAIDALVGPGVKGKAVVVAAGNSSDNRGGRMRHAKGRVWTGLSQSVQVEVPAYAANAGPGNDRILLDIWYKGNDKIRLSVTSPRGHSVTSPYGDFAEASTPDGDVFIVNLGGANPMNGRVEALVIVDDWSGTPPVSGNWVVKAEGEEIADTGDFHLWLLEESIVGASQPYLTGPAANHEALVGKPGGTYNGITVGSYALHDPTTRFRTAWTDANGTSRMDASAVPGDISDFSSPGRTIDGRVKPEVVAPGERVLGAVSSDAIPGQAPESVYRYHDFPDPEALIVDRTPGRSFGVLQGTSFAAPVVTGLVARLLSEDPRLDAVQIRNILVNSAVSDSWTGEVPNPEWGYGKADLAAGGALPLPPHLRITTDSLPQAETGESITLALSASGGIMPYSWSLASGSLPPGLTFEATGYLSGRPTAAGSFAFTVAVADASTPRQQVSRPYRLTVSTEHPLHITKTLHPVGRIGKSYKSANEAAGGVSPYTWSVVGGELPPGLSLAASGLVTGVPSVAGRFPFTLKVLDGRGASDYRSGLIKVLLDGEVEWTALGIDTSAVVSIAVDPLDGNHVFCATNGENGVFESRDDGRTWSLVSGNRGITGTPWKLRFDRNGGPLWLGEAGARLLWYDSGSGYWNRSAFNPPYSLWNNREVLRDFEVDFTGKLSVVNGADIVVWAGGAWNNVIGYYAQAYTTSSDKGLTWLPQSSTVCAVDWGSSGKLGIFDTDLTYSYFSGYVGHNYLEHVACVTDDGGRNWYFLGGTPGITEWSVSSVDRFSALAFFGGGVRKTRDGGRNWTQIVVPWTATVAVRPGANPATVYAGTDQGLYRSTDEGATWSQVSLGPLEGAVTALTIDPGDPSRLWVATARGVARTVDGGASWQDRSMGLYSTRLRALALGHSNSDDLLLASSRGLFVSRTAGEKLVLVQQGVGRIEASEAVISGANGNIYYASTPSALYRSDDRGVSWQQLDTAFTGGAAIIALMADPFDEDGVIAALGGTKGTYRSRDKGGTWEGANVGLPFNEPKCGVFALDRPGRLYLGFDAKGVYRSDDVGATWTPIGPSSQTIDLLEAAPSDSDYLYAVSGANVYFKESVTGPWQLASTPPTGTILSLAVDPRRPLVAYAGCRHPGTAGSRGGVYSTVDGGRTWTAMPGVLDADSVVSVRVNAVQGNVVFAVTEFSGAFRSDDGGSTWQSFGSYGTVADVVNALVVDPSNPNVLFAATEGYGVQVSPDGGKTFLPRVAGLADQYVSTLAFDPDAPATVYAATRTGIYKSSDSGTAWGATALTVGDVTDLVTDNSGAAKRIWATVRGEGIAYSPDAGATFSIQTTGLLSLQLTGLEIETRGSAKRIWATTAGGSGVVYSDDLGATWKAASGNGLTDRNVSDLAIQTGAAKRIWATTSSGVFVSDDDGLSWSDRSFGLPNDAPVTSASIDANNGELFVSVSSSDGGGVYRGGATVGVWAPFNEGLGELRVRRLTNDGGHEVDAWTSGTTFYAATTGDGVYATELSSALQPGPAISTSALPAARFRAFFTTRLVATGGMPPYAWSVVGGALPVGISLSSDGVLSGVAGQAGLYGFTVQVADSNRRAAQRALFVQVGGGEGSLFLDPILGPIPVGGTLRLSGTGFTAGSVIKLYVATASGATDTNPAGWTPMSWTPTSLTWDVPPSVPLGQGFGSLMVVNTDQGYTVSNVQGQLLYGDDADGLPTILSVNGVDLSAYDPSIPGAHVETVLAAGSTVTITGTGFNGPLVNLYTAAGNIGPLTPVAGGTSTSFQVVIPAGAPAGPGTFQVVNSGSGWTLSNAVAAVLGARISVTSVSVVGTTVTVTGDGFCALTVINLFNVQGGGVVNLGSLNPDGTPVIPLNVLDAQHFTFELPAAAQSGQAYVMALNPPFTPYTSSGTDPGGAFTVP